MNAIPVCVNMDYGSSYLWTCCMHDHATGFSHTFSWMDIINYNINFISLVLKNGQQMVLSDDIIPLVLIQALDMF
jgi:hypothetical protein